MDELWQKTQDPHLHQRWDLRFSTIDYLSRTSQSEPQQFLYSTRLGFGISIAGAGESTGTREINGERTSALKFWSDHPLSLIRVGTGYWKYIPCDDGVRFLTWYDYDPRFGGAGKLIDRALFRPAIGWATAWSFDRLRLWLETGTTPEASRNRALLYAGNIAIALLLGGTALRARHLSMRARVLLAGASMAALAVSRAAARNVPRASRCARIKPN
jgi:hypothetical protein